MAATAPAPELAPATVSTAYDLYYLVNDKRFFWRDLNRGVTLIDGGRDSAILWHTTKGKAGRQLWTDIISVNLTSGTSGKEVVNNCRIDFRGGRFIIVTDAGMTGQADHGRTPIYRDFVRALHSRLALAPQGTIRFSAGIWQARQVVMLTLGVIARLLFVATPPGLVMILREWRALGPLAAGTSFIWPFWKIIEDNWPRTYDPRQPPGELMD
jgi:hypothetical protein